MRLGLPVASAGERFARRLVRYAPVYAPPRGWLFHCIVAAALSACHCGEAPLVRVQIGYGGFEPACVRLTAGDSSGAAPQVVGVATPPGSRQGELLAVVFARPEWGPMLRISVEARELSCTGPVVASDLADVTTSPGQTVPLQLQLSATDADQDGYVATSRGTDCDDARASAHPGAPEVCNGLDDDCSGLPADEGLGVGSICGDAGGCDAVVQCAPDAGTFCAPTRTWYPDGDLDEWGRSADVVYSCTRPDGGYVPDGGDCDDGTPLARPGLAEVCDGLDNNCLGGVDEGFGADGGCTTRYGCPGMNVCALDGGVVCEPTDGGTGLHPDEDGDGSGAPVEVCTLDGGSALVARGDDCDDGDPFTALGFPEICDRRDNDCDGQVDRNDAGVPACPAGAGWVASVNGGGGHHWRSTWSWTDGGAWIVGLPGKYRRHLPSDSFGTAAWLNTDGDCPTEDWSGVWADALTGRAFAVGPAGFYCAHDLPNASDIDQSAAVRPALGDPVSVVGFRDGGALEVYVVGRDGGAAVWLPDAGFRILASTGVRLNDVHGVSPEVMFAAGVLPSASPPDGRLYRFVPPDSWDPSPLPGLLRSTGASVEAVYVVHPKLAYAVTDGGSVLRWDGADWVVHPAPPDAGPLRGVLAFGTSSLFAIDPRTAWEWNGSAWSRLFDAGSSQLTDLHGTNPADIWVASDPEWIYHWPQ